MKITPTPFLASAAILFAAALWGLYWVPVRYLESHGIDGATAVLLLNAPAAVVALVFVLGTWRDQVMHLKTSLLVGAVAGTGLALYGVSVAHTSVIRAVMLFYLMPIWATLMGVYWLGEAADWRRWVAIGCGLLGLYFLTWGNPTSQAFNTGDVLAFLSGWAWAVATALMKRMDEAPIGGMLAVQFFFVAVVAFALGWILGTEPDMTLSFTSTPVLLTFGLSLVALLPAMLMIMWASQFLFPGRVGLLLMAEVVVAVISASLLLPEETLGRFEWIAVFLIILAAVIEILPTGQTRKRGLS